MLLFHNGSIGVEQGELFQVDEVVSFLGVALCQNSHLAADDAAGLFYQHLQSMEAFTGVSPDLPRVAPILRSVLR